MDIKIYSSFLPHTDPDASLAFYRDKLGFEVRGDVGYEGMRWLTVGPPDQPEVSIVLYPPGADPGVTDEERRTITEMMAKGTFTMMTMASKDLDGTFEKLAAQRRRGRPGADRPAVRDPRRRHPRSGRQHDPDQPGRLTLQRSSRSRLGATTAAPSRAPSRGAAMSKATKSAAATVRPSTLPTRTT